MSFTLDGFEIGNRIGAGGFGEVWEARQVGVDRPVAIKVGNTAISDATDQLRFERECKALGRLSTHANIVTVYTSGQLPDGRPILVLEYVDGDTLQKWALNNASTEAQIMNIGSDLASALVEAHSHQILHRDLKPQNVLLRTNGEAILADFGIAQMQDGLRTVTGNVTASAAYAAPEVLDGNRATEQSDVYGIGICMLAAATQSTPFTDAEDTTLYPVLTRVLTAEPPNITEFGYSAPFNDLVQRLLEKDPANRFSSASEVLTELRRLNTGPDSYQRVTPTASSRGKSGDGGVTELPTEGPETITPKTGMLHHSPHPGALQPAPQPATPQPTAQPAAHQPAPQHQAPQQPAAQAQPPAYQQPAPQPVAQVPPQQPAPATAAMPQQVIAAPPAQGYPQQPNVPVGASTVNAGGTSIAPTPSSGGGLGSGKVMAIVGGVVVAALALFFLFGRGGDEEPAAAIESSQTAAGSQQSQPAESSSGDTDSGDTDDPAPAASNSSSSTSSSSSGDNSSTRAEPMPAGQAQQVSGSIDVALDFRDFPIEMVAGQEVSAHLTAMNGTCNSDDEFDLRIRFLGPDGEQIGGNGQAYIFGCQGYRDDWKAEVDGVHTIRFVSGGAPPATGTFEATIATMRRTVEFPSFTGSTVVAATIDRARDSVAYEFDLIEGERVSFAMSSMNGTCNSEDEWGLRVGVLDPDRNLLDDVSNASIFGCDSHGRWDAQVDGPHQLIFFSADGPGSFEAVLGLPERVTETLDADGRIWDVTGSITIPRDSIGFELEMTADQQVSVDLTAMNGTCNSDDEWAMRMILLDPTGEPIGDSGNAGIFGCRAYGPWVAEVDGTHTVLFWDEKGDLGTFEATIGRLGG